MLIKTLFYERYSPEVRSGAAMRCNQYLEEVIVEMGHDLLTISPDRISSKSQMFIPWDCLQFNKSFNSHFSDISIYCDRGIESSPPSRESSKVNILLLHGLYYNINLINNLDCLDIILTTSLYWAEVIQLLLGGNIVSNSSQLRELYASKIGTKQPIIYPLTPPIQVATYDSESNTNFLSKYNLDDLQQEVIFAHSIQPQKASIPAFVGIVAFLVSSFKQRKQLFKVFVSKSNAADIQHELMHLTNSSWFNNFSNISACDIQTSIIFTDRLHQTDLHQLFSLSRFGICYNEVPESFGMYILESILSGCPIFSNGAGNMRHSLPSFHGHYINEPYGLYNYNHDDLASLCKQILCKLDDPMLKHEIHQGRSYIVSKYNIREYKKGFRDVLKAVAIWPVEIKKIYEPKRLTSDNQDIYKLSPLVRSLCSQHNYVFADHQNYQLTDMDFKLLTLIGDSSSSLTEMNYYANIKSLLDKGLICRKCR